VDGTTQVIADRYSLDREIGRGGMGAVWLGRDELLGRRVALKRVGVAPGGGTPEAARAEREAKLAASLTHPHVVSVFDLAQDGDVQWLVMEYVDGVDLAELVRRDGPMSPEAAASVLSQVASALVAAHAAGVVHRDIKPSNILVTPDGQAKLSDFGIARTKGDASLTQTGLVTGSPAYLSPEVASGRSASEPSDIWSLGATAYHAVEGHPPYEIGDNLIGALYRIVHEDPPRPQSPGWLAPFFEATMTQDEATRWDAAQVRDFLDAGPQETVVTPAARRRSRRADRGVPAPQPGHTQVLAPVDATRAGRAASPPAGGPPREGDRRRFPVLPVLAALLVVALLGVGAFLVTGGLDDDEQLATDTPSASAEPSPSETAAPEPNEADMIAFTENYVQTAARNQQRGFDMLTPTFQQDSGGLQGYSGFWSSVSDVSIRSIEADPERLTVSYDYTYRRNGRETTEPVTLRLDYSDGRYLIAGEA
jgi:serine/threonine protein kinase